MSEYRHDDPLIIWAAPQGSGKGRGSFEEPYTSVTHAIARALPGNTVVLIDGEYSGDVTIQNSGSIDRPIRIVAQTKGGARFSQSCWYLYDVCDLILADIAFRDSAHGAISVIGACQRNCFSALAFLRCGTTGDASCTMFFGGSGARCNVVENCTFEAPQENERLDDYDRKSSIGILIAEGDVEQKEMINRNYIVRGNTFSKYGIGIALGSRETGGRQHGHIIEQNIIRDCFCDGIRAKCGDTTLRANMVLNCAGCGIALEAGAGSLVNNNRIEQCATGIQVLGMGHTLRNNCIIGYGQQAVHIAEKRDEHHISAGNIIAEQNTFSAKNHTASSVRAAVRVDSAASCILQRNVFYGKASAYIAAASEAAVPRSRINCFADDNVACGGCESAPGIKELDIAFDNISADNYENATGYGAGGWMARGQKIEEEADKSLQTAESALCENDANNADSLIREVDRNELLSRSLFFNRSDADMQESDISDVDNE